MLCDKDSEPAVREYYFLRYVTLEQFVIIKPSGNADEQLASCIFKVDTFYRRDILALPIVAYYWLSK